MENINVCVRIRPLPNDDNSSNPLFKIEGNSLLNVRNKDIMSYGKSSLLFFR